MPTIGSKSAFERAGELSLSEANANPVITTPIVYANDWGGDDRVRSSQSHMTASALRFVSIIEPAGNPPFNHITSSRPPPVWW